MNATKKYGVKSWDLANFLHSERLIQGYLAEALKASIEDNNPGLFIDALNTAARAYGMHNLAEATGLDRAGLYRALRSGSKPQFATIIKIAHALKVDLTSLAG